MLCFSTLVVHYGLALMLKGNLKTDPSLLTGWIRMGEPWWRLWAQAHSHVCLLFLWGVDSGWDVGRLIHLNSERVWTILKPYVLPSFINNFSFYSVAVIISLNSVLFANLHLMEHIDIFVSAFNKENMFISVQNVCVCVCVSNTIHHF